MNFHELQDMVRNSGWPEWAVLPSVYAADEWSYRATYKGDMLIGLRWGRPGEQLDADWSNRVISPENNRTEYVEVLYAGQPVERVRIANVDGLKCYLPIPRTPGSVEVSEWDFKLARLLQQMTDEGGSYPIDRYMTTTGLNIPESVDRSGPHSREW